MYGKLGGEVVLKVEGASVTERTTGIMWKFGPHIIIDLEGEISDLWKGIKLLRNHIAYSF